MRYQLRTAINQFALGATHPSLPALLGALGVAAALFVLCLLEVTPRTMAMPSAQFILKKSRDRDGRVTLEVLRLRQAPPQGLNVVIIGDSMIYQAIPQPENLENALRARLHVPATVHILASGALTQWEAVPLADSLGEKFRGVVAVEISPFNVAMGGAAQKERIVHPRMALDSPAFRAEAIRAGQMLPRQTGIYFLDHYSFFSTRVDSLLPMPDWYSPHKPGLAEWTVSQWKGSRGKIVGWIKNYAREGPHNMDIYARMIQRLQAKPGVAVALLEGAQNPRNQTIAARPTEPHPYDRYREDMANFARRNGVAYWDIAEAAHLTENDFADYAHLKDSAARKRYISALADRLASLIAEKGLVPGAHP
jgi:hypothetical protein